jgi:hypothetical protein
MRFQACLLTLSLAGCSLVRVDPVLEAEYAALRAEAAAELDEIRPVLEADLKALAAYPWMADRTCVKDASVVLHPLFGFDDPIYVTQGLLPKPQRSESDSDALRKAADKAKSVPEGTHWMTQGADPEVQALRLPWVASLRPFDCWNITANSPWDQVDPLTLDFALPHPLPVELLFASMVLLMQLHELVEDSTRSDQDRIRETLADVRRLATLCIQSQEVVMAQLGANILTREREAVAYLTAQGRMPESWHVVPEVDTDRLLRINGVAPAFAGFFTPSHHQDLATDATVAVGRCAGIREGTRTALSLQGLLEEKQLQWLNGVLDQSAALGCHHDDLRALRDRPEQQLATHAPFDNPLLPPAMRRSHALAFATTGVPSYIEWTGDTD